jgi:hypothetical protein
MKAFFESGDYSFQAATEWYMQKAFQAVDTIVPLLAGRYWDVAISPSGSFIGSDNPVILDGGKGKLLGFANAEIIIYQLSRHVLLFGGSRDLAPPFVNRKYIAHMNTAAMLQADALVFSHVPDFVWLDELGKSQTDWTLFTKETLLNSIPI